MKDIKVFKANANKGGFAIILFKNLILKLKDIYVEDVYCSAGCIIYTNEIKELIIEKEARFVNLMPY